MAIDIQDRPDIEERYQTAGNTSDLTVEADRGGAGDIIIAAGWSSGRVGMALLRLHSEWDSSEKPAKPTPDFIRGLVGTWQRAIPGEAPKLDDAGIPVKPHPLTGAEAVHHAGAWYIHEIDAVVGKLKSLPSVREEVTIRALRWGMGLPEDREARKAFLDDREAEEKAVREADALLQAAEGADKFEARQILREAIDALERRQSEERARAQAKAAGTIRYWLHQTCTACHGLRWQLMPGTPALSNKMCKVCFGGGFGQVPHGQDGRKLANWMDSCVESARAMLQKNLSARRISRKDRESKNSS